MSIQFPDENKLAFGNRLKELREAHGFKEQGDLVQALADNDIDVTLKTIRNWEQGRVLPKAKNLIQLCEFFNVDYDYLLGRIDEPTHITQIIHEETGLDIDAIEKLKQWNTSGDKKKWINYLSLMILHEKSELLFHLISKSLHFAQKEGICIATGKTIDAMQAIDQETAYLWRISQTFNEVIEDLIHLYMKSASSVIKNDLAKIKRKIIRR